MRNEDFERGLQGRLEKIVGTLSSKQKEYAMNDDRLYNFKVAARILNVSPAKALQGMFIKHLVSVFDLIDGKLPASTAMIDEKIGAAINYLILLEAVLHEQITYSGAKHPTNCVKEDKPCDEYDALKEHATYKKLMGEAQFQGATMRGPTKEGIL